MDVDRHEMGTHVEMPDLDSAESCAIPVSGADFMGREEIPARLVVNDDATAFIGTINPLQAASAYETPPPKRPHYSETRRGPPTGRRDNRPLDWNQQSSAIGDSLVLSKEVVLLLARHQRRCENATMQEWRTAFRFDRMKLVQASTLPAVSTKGRSARISTLRARG